MSKVAILGCGPAGLIAAHTVALSGHEVVIYSQSRERSYITGAQFLHKPIAGINGEPDMMINFIKRGTREGYAAKVYGDMGAPCSWDSFPTGRMPAWSMRETYDALWRLYADRIREQVIDHSVAYAISQDHDLTITTIPAPNICEEPFHNFPSARVFFRDDAPANLREGDLLYSGDPKDAFYRASVLDGKRTTEFGHQVKEAREGFKPLDTNCDCLPNIVRAGRFGEWKKGVLVHDAETVARAAVNVAL